MEYFVILLLLLGFLFYFSNKKKKVYGKKEAKLDKTFENRIEKLDPEYKLNQLVFVKNPNQTGIPNIVKQGRILNNGKKLRELHDLYFVTLPEIQVNNHEEINLFLELIDKSLLVIEPLIIYEKKRWKSFDIKSLPAIEKGLLYLSILGYCEKVNEIKEVINFFPELKNLYDDLSKEALTFCLLLPEILEFIKERNSIKIIDLKDRFPEDYELIKSRMYYLAKIGVIKKSKVGNSNIYEIN